MRKFYLFGAVSFLLLNGCINSLDPIAERNFGMESMDDTRMSEEKFGIEYIDSIQVAKKNLGVDSVKRDLLLELSQLSSADKSSIGGTLTWPTLEKEGCLYTNKQYSFSYHYSNTGGLRNPHYMMEVYRYEPNGELVLINWKTGQTLDYTFASPGRYMVRGSLQYIYGGLLLKFGEYYNYGSFYVKKEVPDIELVLEPDEPINVWGIFPNEYSNGEPIEYQLTVNIEEYSIIDNPTYDINIQYLENLGFGYIMQPVSNGVVRLKFDGPGRYKLIVSIKDSIPMVKKEKILQLYDKEPRITWTPSGTIVPDIEYTFKAEYINPIAEQVQYNWFIEEYREQDLYVEMLAKGEERNDVMKYTFYSPGLWAIQLQFTKKNPSFNYRCVWFRWE